MTTRTTERIADAVAELRRRCDLPVDPDRRGPVPLDRLFQAANLLHVSLPVLSTAAIVGYLVAERYVSGPHVLADVTVNDDRIDGFLFWAGADGLAFVNADRESPIARRRFTAAHELGHAVLHREQMGRFRVDAKVNEDADDPDDLERDANRLAAELLMPAGVVAAREAELRRDYGCCPRGVLT
jgi:hypothetical protein